MVKRRQWLHILKYGRKLHNIPRNRTLFGFAPDRVYEIASARYVCVKCRKSWRRNKRRGKKYGYVPMRVCAHCGSGLAQVPVMFRTPRRHDNAGWQKVKQWVVKQSVVCE